ncbi:MAG: rhodanese-like domain-containing protein [Hyphomicrobiales bacterium]|nr:rhodanese-like domain-containing protein [Hyphomicrobiales bacterium]
MILSKLFGRSSGSGASDVIGYDDLRAAMQSGDCALVDVREPAEFRQGHVPGSQNMPLSRFNASELPRDQKIVLICRSGARSDAALRAARQAGLSDISHFNGGVMLWQSLGGPIRQ